FKDNYYGFDDAIFAACRVLEIVASSPQKLSDMLSDLPKTFSTPEIRVDCPDTLKFKIVEELTEHFRSRYEVVDSDGVRIQFDNGWGLVRASNTQPVLVLRFEAKTEDQLNDYQQIVNQQLKKYQPDVKVN
ncbi:MAG: phosphomannomutase, partial [Nitrospinaceae bacterium]